MKHPPESQESGALNHIFWRDEILQVMFWMRGEGLSDAPSAEELAPFLTTDAESLRPHLEHMVADGLVTRVERAGAIRYALSERGRKDGGRLFQEEFEGLTNQAHGECNNPNCACKALGPEACESRQHAHSSSQL
jgi:hypothetical protein